MAAEYNIDDINAHYLYLERLASGGVNSVVMPSLNETYDAIAAILGRYDEIGNRSQLNVITQAITAAIEENNGWALLKEEHLQPLATYESAWEANYAQSVTGLSVSVPEEATILGFINQALMSLQSGQRADVGIWDDFVRSNIDSRSEQINAIVQRGFMRSETVGQMLTQIKTVTEGLLTREAETLARTGYVHYAAQATEAMVKQNADILDEYYYIVTFDNRTSNRCIGVSKLNQPKNRLKVGDPKAPQPPLHFNCRTRRLAVPEGFVLTGTRAAVGGKEGEAAAKAFAAKERRLRKASQVRYKGKKDTDIFNPGQVDASLRYDQWLKQQPRYFIEDTLGPKRTALWLDNGVPLTKFSDAIGRPLTLQEIAQREGIAIP